MRSAGACSASERAGALQAASGRRPFRFPSSQHARSSEAVDNPLSLAAWLAFFESRFRQVLSGARYCGHPASGRRVGARRLYRICAAIVLDASSDAIRIVRGR
jgi:hypothetical protein